MSDTPIVRVWSEPPAQETGSSEPTLFSVGYNLFLAYYSHNSGFPGWSSGASSNHPGFNEQVAVIRFGLVRVHKFGYPNSEAIGTHPLYKCGLQLYDFHTVEHSPWIAELCHQNEIHSRHNLALWEALTHWIVTFEDGTLEVIGRSADAVSVFDSISPAEALHKVTSTDHAT